MNPDQARKWLSEPRFQPFLDASGGDGEAAVVLYQWHASLTSACFELIHHFEILVRNAIDGALGAGQPQEPLRDTWLLDFDTLQPNGIKQVITALERLEQGKRMTRARVIAGVSFGFWAGLFAKGYEELWRHRLRRAFPNGSVTRKDLTERMRLIQRLRNKVAHHDCLLNQDVRGRADDMLLIARWIDVDAGAWLETQSEVHSLLDSKPELPIQQRRVG
jgi:Abi-like protein